jgi:hypothetical protein
MLPGLFIDNRDLGRLDGRTVLLAFLDPPRSAKQSLLLGMD